MRLVPHANVVARRADSFDWPAVLGLDAQIKVDYSGPAGTRADLLLTAVSQTGEQVLKRKAAFTLNPGVNELVVEDLLATTDVLGRRLLTLRVELAAKGAPAVASELEFTLNGPPAPAAEVRELKLYDPRGATSFNSVAFEAKHDFAVGDNFGIEAVIEVTDNPAGLRPRLRIIAVMDEDARESGFDMPRQYHTAHFDERVLDSLEVPMRVRATARLPYFFLEPWNHRHPFTVRVALDFGGGAVTYTEISGEVFDFRPSDDRRNDNLDQRLIGISRGPTWIVSPAHLPDPTGGLYEPPY
jgi:hypothetical protein